MSPRPCLKHIDGSFLIAKWVPTPYQGTQDALITHLSTHISLHSLFHILLACTKLFPSFVPLQTPEMLFSPHSLSEDVQSSLSFNSIISAPQKLPREGIEPGQAPLRGGPSAPYACFTGTCITCSIYSWLCSVYVTLFLLH